MSIIVVFQLLSHVQLLVTPWTTSHQASLSFTVSWSFLRLSSIELMMPSNHLIHCHPLLLLLSIFPSFRVFSYELALHIRWPKYWSLSFSISTSSEYSGLISFRIDWFDLLAVQMALKSLLQHHSSKASILHLSAFFMVHSHIYFSSSHVCMWKMDCKEGWEWKNWCFWIVMPEKTLESPLDCKKIKLLDWWKSNDDFGPWILNHYN